MIPELPQRPESGMDLKQFLTERQHGGIWDAVKALTTQVNQITRINGRAGSKLQLAVVKSITSGTMAKIGLVDFANGAEITTTDGDCYTPDIVEVGAYIYVQPNNTQSADIIAEWMAVSSGQQLHPFKIRYKLDGEDLKYRVEAGRVIGCDGAPVSITAVDWTTFTATTDFYLNLSTTTTGTTGAIETSQDTAAPWANPAIHSPKIGKLTVSSGVVTVEQLLKSDFTMPFVPAFYAWEA